MPAEVRAHAGRHYAVQHHYALPVDAWTLELSEAVPAPAEWAELPGAATHLPGEPFLLAYVPDEDPAAEPTVHLLPGQEERVIPYEVVRWFMARVAEEVANCA